MQSSSKCHPLKTGLKGFKVLKGYIVNYQRYVNNLEKVNPYVNILEKIMKYWVRNLQKLMKDYELFSFH